MTNLTDFIGKTYGRLTVLEFSHRKSNNLLYRCQCACGTIKIIIKSSLTSGDTTSCGCFQREDLGRRARSHGESDNSKEYRTWKHIKGRCLTKTDVRYKDYGGRGITICNQWHNSYKNFLKDMGRAPSPKHSIDRKDNDGNYEPGNCRWATNTEQINNRRRTVRVTLNGVTKPITTWCRELNLSHTRAYYRFKIGLSAEDVLSSGPLSRSFKS